MVDQVIEKKEKNLPPADGGTLPAGAEPAAQPSADAAPQAPKRAGKVRRTPGLWAFDFLVYPVITNIGVFLISVAATYLTNKGATRVKGELVHGKVGEWFHNRGKSVVNLFKGMGFSEKKSDMFKMVFFSFFDGSLVAPFTKLLEDRREKLARSFDTKFGTKPEDEQAAYSAEPKQTWLSVFTSRLAVASIVVPTAAFLSREHNGKSWNDKFFNEPGKRLGQWMAKKPAIAKWFGKLDIAELGKVGIFELFYTSVCTAGLYVTSRFIARMTNKKKSGEFKSILDTNGDNHKNEVLPPSAKEAEITVKTEEHSQKNYTQSIPSRAEKTAKAPASAYTQKVADSTPSPAQPAL